ncbi:hypothetical protein, partial [Pedobacter psychrodurus]|uniref:hypothetical protein n=1 Tax=Pedobacter psychrodurus TaxID=2530456 RepID=UPI00292D22A5
MKEYPGKNILSQEMTDGWCKKRDTEENNSCRARISVVVSFIQYLRKRGKTEVIAPALPRLQKSIYLPHAFTITELQHFFNACDSISGETAIQRAR